MKKLLILTSACAMLVSLSAFGQGFLNFASGKSQTWYNAVPGGGAISTIDVSFLWASANNARAIDTLTSLGLVTTSAARTNLVAWGGVNPNQAAWNAILNDSNWQLAQNAGAGNAVVAWPAIANGSFNYGNVGVNGTTVPETIFCFEIAWLASGGATPALAAAAGSPLGWGNVWSYALTAATAAAGTISGANQFGASYWAPIPEPTTLALAGLGALSLMVFRRRK